MAIADTGSLNQLLKSVGIQRVVWVDDLFDQPARKSESELADLVGRARYIGRELVLEGVGPILVEDDDHRREEIIRQLKIADNVKYKTLIGQLQAHIGDSVDDYTDESLTKLESSFGDILTRIGFTEWNAKFKELMLDRDALVVLDYESKSTNTVNGAIVFEQLCSMKNQDFQIILLTHCVANPEEEELKRHEMDSDAGVRHRFAVMSKSATVADIELHIRRKIRTVITHRSCYSLADSIANVLSESVANCRKALIDQSITHLDRVIFENSLVEGASEIDVLCRIFLLRQRVQVASRIADDPDWMRQLQNLRKLRELEDLDTQESSSSEDSIFREWHQDELFDAPQRLNRSLEPIACGDLFVNTTSNKRYILLGQPCEMAVRGKGGDVGTRKYEDAFWIEIVDEPKSQQGEEPGTPRSEYYRIHDIISHKFCYLNFRAWHTVNVACLDLACFNEDGSLRLCEDDKFPKSLLPGWEKRFKDRQTEVRNALEKYRADKQPDGKIKDAQKYRFELDDLALLSTSRALSPAQRRPKPTFGTGKKSGQVVGIEFCFKRVGRLREPLSTAAYTAFASFRTRPAFLHDFAKGSTSSPSPRP